jgi:hypothetical protein
LRGTGDDREGKESKVDDLGIGKLITGNDPHRDAIHIAVAPVIAGEKLYPGQHVGMKDGRGIAGGTYIGIVDPFLTVPVYPEQRFWLFLYPGSITSLRHHWEHPAFPDEPTGRDAPGSTQDPAIAASMAWLHDYASDLELTYDVLMASADDWIEHGDRLCGGSNLQGVMTSDDFWDHYIAVTGKGVPRGKRDSFFSCTC